MGEAVDIVALLRDGGVIAILVLVLVGVYRRWIVPGWLYDASQEEVRYWRELALRALDIGEAAVGRHDEQAIRRRFVDDDDAVQRRREGRDRGR